MKPLLLSTLALALVGGARAADVQKDILYASPDGIPLHHDARIPDSAGPFPAVVVVHGGRLGSSATRRIPRRSSRSSIR